MQKSHSLGHKQAEAREKCQPKQPVPESEHPLSSPLFLLPTNPHLKMRHFQDNPVCTAPQETQTFCKAQPMHLCTSYSSKGTHVASKWDTPAQLELGRQGWLLTFQFICTGRGRSARKGGFTLAQGLHYSGQKLVAKAQGQLLALYKARCIETGRNHVEQASSKPS